MPLLTAYNPKGQEVTGQRGTGVQGWAAEWMEDSKEDGEGGTLERPRLR